MKVRVADVSGTREFQLKTQLTIGRKNADIVIATPDVSTKHAVLQRIRGHTFVTDLGSTNGTTLNGALVTPRIPTAIRDGDTITVGLTTLQVSDNRDAVPQFERILESTSTMAPSRGDDMELLTGDELREDHKKLRLALELSDKLAVVETPQQVYRILEEFCEAIPGWDQANVRSEDSLIRMLLPKGDPKRSLSTRVLAKREAVLLGNDHAALGLAIPLTADDRVLGVLAVESSRPLTERDLSLVVSIGHQASNALHRLKLRAKTAEDARTRDLLGRFLAPGLADRIHRGELAIELGGETRDVIVMATDIVGFTTVSEQIGPQATIAMLNEYFEVMVDAVFAHRGAVDKFIGDAIFATWGVFEIREDDGQQAVEAALEMNLRLGELNQVRRERGDSAIAHRIGIHAGPAVVGLLGSKARMEFTVIGDTANVASRLESAASPGQILVSQTLRGLLSRAHLTELPPIRLKGKRLLERVYEVSA